MEGRLDTGGYSGPGYYLENDDLKEVEHEAMLEGNATMREYEDTVKYKENEMSLKEWKNNELNKQLLKKFGILKENKKPDFPDVDGDGDREEPISKAQKDKKAKGSDDNKSSKPKKGEVPPQLQKHVKGKKEDDKEEMEEGRNNPRTTNSDKFAGHEDRYLADRIHEEKDDTEDDKMKVAKKKKDLPDEEPAPTAGALQEALKKIARAKSVYLGNKRIK
jgi:hypothetical protein